MQTSLGWLHKCDFPQFYQKTNFSSQKLDENSIIKLVIRKTNLLGKNIRGQK